MYHTPYGIYVPNDIWDQKITLQIRTTAVLAWEAELWWRTVLPHFRCVLQQLLGKKYFMQIRYINNEFCNSL